MPSAKREKTLKGGRQDPIWSRLTLQQDDPFEGIDSTIPTSPVSEKEKVRSSISPVSCGGTSVSAEVDNLPVTPSGLEGFDDWFGFLGDDGEPGSAPVGFDDGVLLCTAKKYSTSAILNRQGGRFIDKTNVEFRRDLLVARSVHLVIDHAKQLVWYWCYYCDQDIQEIGQIGLSKHSPIYRERVDPVLFHILDSWWEHILMFCEPDNIATIPHKGKSVCTYQRTYNYKQIVPIVGVPVWI